jgi:hypothetical protein
MAAQSDGRFKKKDQTCSVLFVNKLTKGLFSNANKSVSIDKFRRFSNITKCGGGSDAEGVE